MAPHDRATYIQLVAHITSERMLLSGLLLQLVDLGFPIHQVSLVTVHDLRDRRKQECQLYTMQRIHQKLQLTETGGHP